MSLSHRGWGPRSVRWVLLDVGLCVVLMVSVTLPALVHLSPEVQVPAPVVGALCTGAVLSVAIRRLWVVPAVVLMLFCVGALVAFGHGQDPLRAPGLVVPPLVLYLVATRFRRGRAVGVLVVTGIVLVVAGVAASLLPGPAVRGQELRGELLVVAMVAVAAWAAGFTVRLRRALLADYASQQAARARAEERLRIAREMHDIVAHAMSLIAMQAGVGQYLARTRPDKAEEALASIADTSRGALVEIRRALGVLRYDGEPDLPSGPGIAELPELAAGSGVGVDLRVEGGTRELPMAVNAACYRIVQEAITNVVKHSGADRCEVSVRCGDDAVLVEITDPGPTVHSGPIEVGNGDGYGLAGMRERVELLGGELESGPLPAGGFRVWARLRLADGA